MKIELKREEKGVDIINFYLVFEPETVEETLTLKELESELPNIPNNRWEGTKFIIDLTWK